MNLWKLMRQAIFSLALVCCFGSAAYAESITYAGREVPVLLESDVCVVGGGVSGVSAAVSAGARGARTCIVEKGITLGGLQTLGNVYPLMPTRCLGSDTPFIVRLITQLKANGIDCGKSSSDGIAFNPEVIARIYDELCEGAGVEVLYNTTLTDVVKDGDDIAYGIVYTIAGPRAVKAKLFIDATGDAFLSRLAGVPTEKGDPTTGQNQCMSMRFEMAGVDWDKLYNYIAIKLNDPWCKERPPHFEFAETRHQNHRYILEDFMLKGVRSGELTEADIEYLQAFTIIGKKGAISFNCPELPRAYSATNPISYSRAVAEGRQMMRRISQYMIKHMPGFENAYISKEPALMGVRESWRIKGKVYLTEDDYYTQSRYHDAVARTAWYIDTHGAKIGPILPEGAFYEIPYRALVTNEVPNLIVVGRCVSASFALQASLRIQPTCMSMGEAGGIAAAWAIKHNIPANAVEWDKIPAKERSYVTAGNTGKIVATKKTVAPAPQSNEKKQNKK